MSVTLREDVSPALLMPATMIGHESIVVEHPVFLYCIVGSISTIQRKSMLLISNQTMVRQTCHTVTLDATTAK